MLNIVAIVTPYNNYGKVDWKNFNLIINYFLFNKINYLLIFGTTGESYIFNKKTYFETSKFVNKFNINCLYSCNVLRINKILEILILLKINKILSVLIPPQSYILPNNYSIFKYYKILKKVGINIIIYNIFKRTSVFLSLNLIKKINLHIYKNSNNNKNNLLLKKLNKIFFCGEDKNIFFCKTINYIGTISILNNIFPKLFNYIEISKFNNIVKNIFLKKNPILVKYLLFKNSLLNKNCKIFSLISFYFTQSQI